MLRLTWGCYIIDGVEDDVNNNNNNISNNNLLICRICYNVILMNKVSISENVAHKIIRIVCKKNNVKLKTLHVLEE